MKISYNWLKEYVPCLESPARVAELLTAIGLEVESAEETGGVRGGFAGVVAGHVLECVQHPDADRLRVTKVDVGAAEPLQIVCGAPNVAAGQKVPVATIGATLYFANGEEIKIKRSKLRGVDSLGMICAEDELGVGASHDGIMVLDANVKPGTPLRDVLHVETDTIFEIGLTPNRIDAASHFGVARDLAAVLGLEAQLPSTAAFSEGPGHGVAVTVENTAACPRYSGITIQGVKVQDSPEWLQKRLKAIGLRPINNVVDVTNFVLHEVGQPLHAFDVAHVDGRQIVVRTCKDGAPFVTLDGVTRKLSDHDLMICSASQPMCIAGVFGGLNAGVTGTATEVFLESAYFNPVWVRKTARRHGLNTDASFRYERGADPAITLYALKRAALLIQEVAGGTVVGKIADCYPQPVQPATVQLRFDRMARLIGKAIPPEQIKRILTALDFVITGEDAGGLVASAPTYRVDVTREADVVEELLRIYGYNNVEIPGAIQISVNARRRPDKERLQDVISDYLTANGFYEMMNNSLTKGEYYTKWAAFPASQEVKIHNPLSSDLNVMRRTLLFGGLEAITRNINRQASDLKLYEFGNTSFYDPEKADRGLAAYTETACLALFMTGMTHEQSWAKKQEASGFFVLKGYVEKICARFGVNSYNLETAAADSDLFSDGIVLRWKSKPLATIAVASHALRKQFDIKQDVYMAEIGWDVLLEAQQAQRVLFAELPKFPEVRRDLALVVDEAVTFAQLYAVSFKTEKRLLKQVNLFDVYRGGKLPAGKKQYALGFTLQSADKTLADQDIERLMNNLLKAFEREAGAVLR
ncbi:MAG: phenylalanine--tRNA ligase subunit beta [Prevotellaceae bacterium]|jgi:phenylalanyl-tRNA synthetase beta chain|nr:phenylalanine--tRNA ligase subunit beta [Prevotellaceae bacterium]